MIDYLYVHLDTMSNAVLTKGITHVEFNHSTQNRPKNILLLNPNETDGEYENHTGLKVVRGEDQVNSYFLKLENRSNSDIKWIDFKEYEILKQLTALEISELLYFSHMKKSLHSPFFYKLQNDFVFFGLDDATSKIYYRHIDEFFCLISEKLSQQMSHWLNRRRSFLSRKKIDVRPVPLPLISELKGCMQDGLAFDLVNITSQSSLSEIRAYIVEDNFRNVDKQSFGGQELACTITYDSEEQKWHLQKEEMDWDFAEIIT